MNCVSVNARRISDLCTGGRVNSTHAAFRKRAAKYTNMLQNQEKAKCLKVLPEDTCAEHALDILVVMVCDT